METQEIPYDMLRECSIKVDLDKIRDGIWITDLHLHLHLYDQIRKTDNGIHAYVWYIDNYDLQLRMAIMELGKNHCIGMEVDAEHIYLPNLGSLLDNTKHNFDLLKSFMESS